MSHDAIDSAKGGTAAAAPLPARLLLVDDEQVLCRRYASELAKRGFQVVTAFDVAGALSLLADSTPDIAFVDLTMPSGSGLDVIRKLKHLHGEAVHVVVMTGHDDEQSHAAAFAAGADDYLVKPVAFPELERRIAAALRTQRAFVTVRLDKEAAERRLVYGQEASALLAHDLNNGLSVALGNLSCLLDDDQVAAMSPADQRDALAATMRSVRRMSGLVANFVDVARFEDAAVKPSVQTVAMRRILDSVVDVSVPTLRGGVAITIDCPSDLTAKLDGGLIERVLHNLVGNAVRYCSPGGKIVVSAKRWHELDGGSIELVVSNTGVPVPEALRDNLFAKYVRGRDGKRGMGLYFCRLVAEAHGGVIAHEANAEGPAFVVRLPGHA